MQDGFSNMLSTPIKKIRELTIHSPGDGSEDPAYGFLSSVNRNKSLQHQSSQDTMSFSRQDSISPIRYPSMSEFSVKPVPLEQISQSMLDRGYSRTLGNKVLRELDNRANEISRQISTGHNAKTRPSNAKLKRYSQFHKPIFQKMESISSHYAATRGGSTHSQSNDLLSSASKKRRTLNGPEEIFAMEKENESPVRRKDPAQRTISGLEVSSTPFMGAVPSLKKETPQATPLLSSPYRDLDASPYVSASPQVSPVRTLDPASQSSSPTKFTRISPSKGSMNLNKLLLDDFEFAKPEGPVKIRQSSLQMAGVVPTTGLSGIPQLQKKPSSSSLQKKPSLTNFQGSSLAGLNKKPSIGSLQRASAPSTHSTQRAELPNSNSSRIASTREQTLNKKPLVSLLLSRTGTVTAQKETISLLKKKLLLSTLNRSSSAQPSPKVSNTRHIYNLPNSSSQRSSISHYGKLLDPTLSSSQSSHSILSRSNITIPKPFSLYDKPTISSSQKSFGAMQSSASLRSLALNLTSRSGFHKQ